MAAKIHRSFSGAGQSTDVTVTYAELTEDSGRFDEAKPVSVPSGTQGLPVDRRAFPQREGALDPLLGNANREVPQSSDAFQLRIQAPEDAEMLPVFVFIPGGGFTTGTGNARWFSDPPLVHQQRCILVTVNYRIGILGHLGISPHAPDAQRPLRDIVLALRWVRENINAWGGDPDNITLGGDSAGAWYVYALATMTESEGMFRRAALISMPFAPPLTPASHRTRWELVATQLEEHGGLEGASLSQLLAAQATLAQTFAGREMPLMPTEGGPLASNLHDFATSASSLHVESLLLLGTSEEAAAFIGKATFPHSLADEFLHNHFKNPDYVNAWVSAKSPSASGRQRMVELRTLYQFTLSNLELAEAASRADLAVYLARFSIGSSLQGFGSPHCMPLPFLFGNAQTWSDAPMIASLDPEVFRRSSEYLRTWVGGFIQDGVPRVDSNPAPIFDPEKPLQLEFDGRPPHAALPSELHLQARRPI